MSKELQQEDTVSADRKIRIIVDPKTGKRKKTSAVTSRQNFDSEKFGNRNADSVADAKDVEDNIKEGTQIESLPANANDREGDTKADAKLKTKSAGAIEFVTGTQPNADEKTGALAKNTVASASVPGYHKEETMSAKTLAEAMIKKALTQVKTDKNVGTEDIPFDGPYTKPKAEKNSDGTPTSPMSKVRQLAKQAMNKQKPVKEEVEQVEEGVKGALIGGALGAVATGAALPALAGAYIGHKIQQKKQKEAAKEQPAPKKTFKEAWEDMLKAAAEKRKPQPNGGAGKKQGSAYGGSKQKEEPVKDED